MTSLGLLFTSLYETFSWAAAADSSADEKFIITRSTGQEMWAVFNTKSTRKYVLKVCEAKKWPDPLMTISCSNPFSNVYSIWDRRWKAGEKISEFFFFPLPLQPKIPGLHFVKVVLVIVVMILIH